MPNEEGRPVLVVLGDGGVGKTSIILRFTNDKFEEGYIPTLEDHYQTTVKLSNGETVDFDVADTAGQDDFQSLRDQYMVTGDIFMVVFSLCDSKTLKTAENLLKNIKSLRQNAPFKFLLVANMCDRECTVSFDDAKRLAESFGGDVIQTSAKTNVGISASFEKLAELFTAKEKAGGCCRI